MDRSRLHVAGRGRQQRSRSRSISTVSSAVMALIVTGVGSLIHIYSIGYMKDDTSYARYFAYLNLFLFFMLLLVLGTLAARALRRLGRRGPRLVSADRLLVRGPGQGARRQEGVHHQPDRRRGLPARDVRALPGARHARHGSDQRGVLGNGRPGGVGEPRRHPAVHRRVGQVGADPAARLAAGRDGRPDAGLRADPRGDDGHRGRVPGRAPVRRSICMRPRQAR